MSPPSRDASPSVPAAAIEAHRREWETAYVRVLKDFRDEAVRRLQDADTPAKAWRDAAHIHLYKHPLPRLRRNLMAARSATILVTVLAAVALWAVASGLEAALKLPRRRVILGAVEQRLLRAAAAVTLAAGWGYVIWAGV